MLQSIGINNYPINNIKFKNYSLNSSTQVFKGQIKYNERQKVFSSNAVNMPNTELSPSDEQKYLYLMNFLKDVPISENAEGLSCNKQLDCLLKNGKLLKKSSHDNSTTLDNLYDIATKERICNLDQKNLISNVLDILINPRRVTQNFGAVSEADKKKIIPFLKPDDEARKDPQKMDVSVSGVCPAASLEVNMADKYPAEYVNLISGISSKNRDFTIEVDLEAINPNKLEALTILDSMKAQHVGPFSFKKNKFKFLPDDNAYIKAQLQDKNWSPNERNVADVLFQSLCMQQGSQQTYNSLIDKRYGEYSDQPQGLIEIEKTYVESMLKNREITSLIYQKIDDNQNLIGYNCSFDKIEKHIKDTIDSGDDVIIGYVLTNETAGITQSEQYNPQFDGDKNKIINGHEITIVDYKTDTNGQTTFICVDTDDDNPNFVEYSAEWLLPKIHHAGYPADIVKDDVNEILNNAVTA